jgi:hypothetical protein
MLLRSHICLTLARRKLQQVKYVQGFTSQGEGVRLEGEGDEEKVQRVV